MRSLSIETPRLVLKSWEPEDLLPFRALNAAPEIMRFFPSTLSGIGSDALAARLQHHIDDHDFGIWAVHAKTEQGLVFASMTGLAYTDVLAPAGDRTEIVWRFAKRFWHQGLAQEAARVAIEDGFARVKFAAISAFTAEVNEPSWRLMERLGMTFARRFAHPKRTEDHPLSLHRNCARKLAT